MTQPEDLKQCTKLDSIDKTDINLLPIERLTRKIDFDHWHYVGEMFHHDVAGLINEELERPAGNNNLFTKWRQLSVNIANWLRNQISREILEDIRDIAPDLDYANDTYWHIENYCKGDASNKMGWSQ